MLIVLATIVVLSVGTVRGGLPHPSLDFRWRYWTASAEMFGEYWPTGVGAENFGDHYLKYKPIDSPEEVKNPHNFLVQFATEYGAIGLAGALLMLLGGSMAATRPTPRGNPPADGDEADSDHSVVVAWSAVAVACAMGGRLCSGVTVVAWG